MWTASNIALKKVQKGMKQQVDKGMREAEKWKKGDKVILSIKDLAFKK